MGPLQSQQNFCKIQIFTLNSSSSYTEMRSDIRIWLD